MSTHTHTASLGDSSKKVLIVCSSFPPNNTADLHRVRMSLPHYQAHGWIPSVLCVGADHQDSPREEALLNTIPAEVTIHRTGALPLSLCARLGVRNLGLRAFPHLFFAGLKLLRRDRPDLVFFSTTQFALLPLARLWYALTGIPCVVDLQDPWVTDAYSKPGAPRPPGGWKYRVAHLQARLLEGWSLRRIAALMTVSADYTRDLARRHRWFDTIPSDVIVFGASKTDQEAACPHPRKPDGLVHVVYTGVAGFSLAKALDELLGGLALLRERDPAAAAKLRLHFIGTNYCAEGEGAPVVTPKAKALGISDLVDEIPHRVGHLECIARQREADLLLLPCSLDPAYSPSKLYPYIHAGRPILALVSRDSVLERLLGYLNCAHRIDFSPESPAGACAGQIAEALARAARGSPVEDVAARNHARFTAEYDAEALAARQCELFDIARASKGRRPDPNKTA